MTASEKSEGEMVRACAEAMGIALPDTDPVALAFTGGRVRTQHGWEKYDPLHDDAQAMALMKRFKLTVHHINHISGRQFWDVSDSLAIYSVLASNADLNRAIVECVSRLSKAHP